MRTLIEVTDNMFMWDNIVKEQFAVCRAEKAPLLLL